MIKKLLLSLSVLGLVASVTPLSFAEDSGEVADPNIVPGEENVDATISQKQRANFVILKCRQCHALESHEKQKTGLDSGPSLFGIVGRPVASAGGYNYSEYLKKLAEEEPVWTEGLLMAYLYSPTIMLRTRLGDKKARGKMGFRLNRVIDRQAVLLILKSLKNKEE